MTTTTDYEPPSRRVSRESLGDWALKDVMACRALQAGIAEAELIHALVQDRQRLMEQPHESISRTPPPIALAQPEPAGLTDKEIIGCMYKGAASLSGLEPTWIARNTAECVAGVRAVLARFTRPAIKPVPVSERLPGPEDCDTEGRVWLYRPQTPILNPYWDLVKLDYIDPAPPTHWLPHHALPVPATRSEES